MRRPSLSTKLLAAAVPLLIAVGALLFVTVRNDLETVNDAERSAQLGGVWSPMVDALSAVDAERDLATADALAAADDTPPAMDGADTSMVSTAEATVSARKATDDAIAAVRTSIEAFSENPAAVAHITSARSSLSAARRNIDMAAANMIATTEPLAAYGLASSELVAVARLLPPAAGDPALGRQLLAVQKIAEANLAAGQVIAGVNQFTADPTSPNALVSARSSLDQLESALNEFEVIAPEEWASQFRRSGMTIGFASFRIDVDRALRATDLSDIEPIDVEAFSTLITEGNEFQREISSSIVAQAEADATETRRSTLIRIGIIGGAVALAMLVTWVVTRSIAKRVRAVAKAANQVATRQLPALVHAMRDPKGRALPAIDPVDAKGHDELSELAESFNTMQRTLVSVAEEQVAVLRKGVSDIFITMARRNRSLVDRQLAMLDGFESQVDDPDVLSNYYQLDHLATRMRRNAESLLVLANEEPRRRRVGPTDVDNVVRASIGEIEDYRRIQVEHLDSMKVRGNVVADIAHLFAELLDNAAQFSPPNSTVRVGGRRTPDGYTVRINDGGVGISPDRLEELNELLQNPPIVGLSVEPTLGMSVVSLLAAKHGIKVTLMAGTPGLTVDVELPNAVSADVPEPSAAIGGTSGGAGSLVAGGLGAVDGPAMVGMSGAVGDGLSMIPATVPAAAAASNGLRIDDDLVAQFAAGQGPQMTSASVNALLPAGDPVTAGINGFGNHGHDDQDADGPTFVMPDSFGTDENAYGVADTADLADLATGRATDVVGGSVGEANTFAMPDAHSVNTALAAAVALELARATKTGAPTGHDNTFAMPNATSIDSALAGAAAPVSNGNDDTAAPGAPTGAGSTFVMPDEHSIETALTTASAPTPGATTTDGNTFAMPDQYSVETALTAAHATEHTNSAEGSGNTFVMPDQTSVETALTAAHVTEHTNSADGSGNTFVMPDETSIETALASNPTPGASVTDRAGATTADGSTVVMPDQYRVESALAGSHPAEGASASSDTSVGDESHWSTPDVAPARPIYTRIDPFLTETAADAAERADTTFAMPDLFGTDPTSAPTPPAEPMFRPTVLFGGSDEPASGASGNDIGHPTQLDRPNITARLTHAFQRSHLTHTPPVPAAPPTAAPTTSSSAPDGQADLSSPATAAGITVPTYPSQRPAGEFSRPMSPPVSPSGPTSKPVTPADAYPAPPIVNRAPLTSPLPTRRAAEVDGGHDRMADLPSSVSVNAKPIDEEATALAAALAAFDRRLENHHAANSNGNGNNGNSHNDNAIDSAYDDGTGKGVLATSFTDGNAAPSARLTDGPSLPTRSPAAVTAPMSNYDEMPESTTTSRLDPEQLRERLRSFHTGVRGSAATDDAPSPPNHGDHGDHR